MSLHKVRLESNSTGSSFPADSFKSVPLTVSPASVEMRIGTQVLEGTCRLQDTAFCAGVQVVLARRFADIKCPAEYSMQNETKRMSLSRCGTLCVYGDCDGVNVVGFDTETFDTVFSFEVHTNGVTNTAISQCKTRCYLACWDYLLEVALPGGEVLRKVDCFSNSVFACGNVVVSQGTGGVSVYDEDLTLLRSLSFQNSRNVAVSECGGWVLTSSIEDSSVRLWDVNTGVFVVCLHELWCELALSRSASVFAVGNASKICLYDWSGAALRSVDVGGAGGAGGGVQGMQFTPCGKYLVARVPDDDWNVHLHQYDVATMSCVHVIPQDSVEDAYSDFFAISPCSRVVMIMQGDGVIRTRHLYPHNSE